MRAWPQRTFSVRGESEVEPWHKLKDFSGVWTQLYLWIKLLLHIRFSKQMWLRRETHSLWDCFMSHGMILELSQVRLGQMMKFQKKGMDLKAVWKLIRFKNFTDKKFCGRKWFKQRGQVVWLRSSLYGTLIQVRMCVRKRWGSQPLSTGCQSQADFVDSLEGTILLPVRNTAHSSHPS